MQLIKCKYCNNKFECFPSDNRRFCSSECYHLYRNRPNKINIKQDYAEIEINSKLYGLVKVLIDLDDVKKVNSYRWFVSGKKNNLYIKSKGQSIHRYLLNCDNELVIDHINGNTFDNRKQNLRICTQLINTHNRIKSKNNTSGHTGVYKLKNNKYMARIFLNKKFINLGTFDNLKDALNKRNEAKYEMEVLLSNSTF